MDGQRQRRWRLDGAPAVALALSLVLVARPSSAAPPAGQSPEPTDHLIVVRLSSEMLNSLIGGKTIDRQVPVSDVVLGTPVVGAARIVGQPRVDLASSPDQARFEVSISGTVYSRTTGRNGPAIIQGHSITYFTATKEVVFKPGEGFQGLPPRVRARTQCFTDHVGSTRGGLVGRIVARRASREVAESEQELNEIARQRATRRILAAFDQHMDGRLARLNRVVGMRSLLAALRDRDADEPRVACRTTPQYVEITDASAAAAGPAALPAMAAAGASGAPVEIWLNASLIPENVAQALETLFTEPDQSKLLGALALLPGTVGKDAAAAVHALTTDNKIAVRNLGEWLVVEISTQPASAVTMANQSYFR